MQVNGHMGPASQNFSQCQESRANSEFPGDSIEEQRLNYDAYCGQQFNANPMSDQHMESLNVLRRLQ